MRILLADDHVLFREAMMQFMLSLRPDWKIEISSSFTDAYNKLENGSTYDLVLLDLRMPGMNGTQGLSTLIKHYPKQYAAILSGVAEEHHVHETMAIGSRAYFPKTLSGKVLVRAIELVISGQKFIPMDETGQKLMPAYYDDHQDINNEQTVTASEPSSAEESIALLTPREREVMQYLAQGLSNKDIAANLTLQISTIKLHVGNICKKLKVKNRTQAAIAAYQYGLTTSMHIGTDPV
jgi:two-component system nitrate/nitrite response regulator NarL